MNIENLVWTDKKRPLFGLPLSFTRYTLVKDKLLIDSGFLSTNQEEIKLYRVMDLTLKRSLLQRLFGVGTIHICSGDKTTPEFDIKDVKNPFEVKETISKMVEEERAAKRVTTKEILSGEDEADNDHK